MDTGKIIAGLRDKRGWSQSDLAEHSGVSRVMIGKYERDEAVPSIDAAKKIAAALGVSLDYLAGLTDNQVDAATLNKVLEIQALAEADRRHIMITVDALLRDAKARRAYA